VSDVVAAIRSARDGVLQRERAVAELVQQKRDAGMTYEQAVAAVHHEVRTALERAGLPTSGVGISPGAIRAAVERPRG
jgi:hypothetical protein